MDDMSYYILFLWKGMSCRRTFLILEDISCWRTYLMGGYVLLEDMSYGRICLMRRYILLEACLKGGHVLDEVMSYRRMFPGQHINITGRTHTHSPSLRNTRTHTN